MAVKIPETYTPKKGDVVTIRATIQHDFDVGSDRHVFCRFDGHPGEIMLMLESVEAFVCRAWKAGDRVHLLNSNMRGTIRAIADGQAWIYCRNGAGNYVNVTCPLNLLEPDSKGDSSNG